MLLSMKFVPKPSKSIGKCRILVLEIQFWLFEGYRGISQKITEKIKTSNLNLEKLIFYKCFSKLYHKPSKSQNCISGTKIRHFLLLFEGLGTNIIESNIKYKKFQLFRGKIHIICKNF